MDNFESGEEEAVNPCIKCEWGSTAGWPLNSMKNKQCNCPERISYNNSGKVAKIQ